MYKHCSTASCAGLTKQHKTKTQTDLQLYTTCKRQLPFHCCAFQYACTHFVSHQDRHGWLGTYIVHYYISGDTCTRSSSFHTPSRNWIILRQLVTTKLHLVLKTATNLNRKEDRIAAPVQEILVQHYGEVIHVDVHISVCMNGYYTIITLYYM